MNCFYKQGFKHRFCGKPLNELFFFKRLKQSVWSGILIYRPHSEHIPATSSSFGMYSWSEAMSRAYGIDDSLMQWLGRSALLIHTECRLPLRIEEIDEVMELAEDPTPILGTISRVVCSKIDVWPSLNLTLDRHK